MNSSQVHVYLVKFDGLREERIRVKSLRELIIELEFRMSRLGKSFEWIIRVYD